MVHWYKNTFKRCEHIFNSGSPIITTFLLGALVVFVWLLCWCKKKAWRFPNQIQELNGKDICSKSFHLSIEAFSLLIVGLWINIVVITIVRLFFLCRVINFAQSSQITCYRFTNQCNCHILWDIFLFVNYVFKMQLWHKCLIFAIPYSWNGRILDVT